MTDDEKEIMELKARIAELESRAVGALEFVSYDGKWPSLCWGTLRFKLGAKLYVWEDALHSSGRVERRVSGDYTTISGLWSVKFPGDFPEFLRPAVTEMVNENVEHGCCGGCI